MGVHSGKFGVLNGISTVRNWSIVDDITNPKFSASNTKNGTGRETGVQDWNGSFGVYGSIPPILPGVGFAFLGYTAPTTDVSGTNGLRGSGNAIVDSAVITWNWANGDIISIVENFSGNGALAWATGAVVTDVTAPEIDKVCGTKIQQSDDGTTYTDLPACTQAVLTLSAANQQFVNSDTLCWTGRKPGILDFSIAITREDDTQVMVKGANKYLKMFVNATEFWLFKWAKVKGFTGLTVSPETGEIIKHTVNMEMSGFVGGVTGQITLPDTTVYWP